MSPRRFERLWTEDSGEEWGRWYEEESAKQRERQGQKDEVYHRSMEMDDAAFERDLEEYMTFGPNLND